MSAALPLIIAFIAVLSSLACAQEVAYAHGESGGQPLESGNITAYNGTDLVTSSIPGAGPSLGGSGMTLEEMKREIALKLNVGNPRVRDEGMSLILEYPGDGTINQICSIYEHMVANWSYARDTRGREVLQYSNQSLDYGKGRFSGQGDCDDFAILLASLVESVGGTSRIILAYGPQGGHAYAEVYLGRAGGPESDVQRMLSWLKKNYKVEKINTHWDLKTDDVWLNLDWWKDPNTGRELTKHPGGPFFEAASQVPIHTREGIPPQPLKPVNEPPEVLFAISPEMPVVGLDASFDASESRDIGGRIEAYEWDFGDGNKSGKTGQPITSHIYSKGGPFTVTLALEDDEGAGNSSFRDIIVNNPPQASFSFHPLAPKPNETVTFDASQSKDIEDGTLRYNWSFGDGDYGIGIRKLHPYLQGDIYRVNLTVIDINGAENSTFRDLKVNRPPHSVIRYDKKELNAGGMILFDASDSTDNDGSIIGYFWDFGDGNTSEEKSPTHVYQLGGDFIVNLTVKDSDNATDINISRIMINERPNVAFTFSPIDPVLDEKITFNASESNDTDGIVEYIWDFGEGKKPDSWTEPEAYYFYNKKGNFEVELTVVDSKGAKNAKKERIEIGPLVATPKNQAPEMIDLTSSPSSPQEAGSMVTWTASARDPESDPLEFQFSLDGNVVQDWSSSSVWSWTADQVGSHVIQTNIRDGQHDSNGDSSMNASFEIMLPPNNSPVISDLSSDKESPQGAGTTVAWTATASDSENDPLEFQFWLDGNMVQDWSPSPTWSWAADQVGAYTIQTEVRDGQHDQNGDDSRIASFEIMAPNSPADQTLSPNTCTGAELTTGSGSYASMTFCLPPDVWVEAEGISEAIYSSGSEVAASMLLDGNRVVFHLIYPCQAPQEEMTPADLKLYMEAYDPVFGQATYNDSITSSDLVGHIGNLKFIANQRNQTLFLATADLNLSDATWGALLKDLMISINEGVSPPGVCQGQVAKEKMVENMEAAQAKMNELKSSVRR